MLITEMRDAYRGANMTLNRTQFALQLETMKDEVKDASHPTHFSTPQVFNKTDTNKDGVISLDEFATSVDKNEKTAEEVICVIN
jgi:hypothetical protein